MRVCSVCGATASDSAQFCSQCGGTTVPVEPQAPVYDPAPIPVSAPVAVAEPKPKKKVKWGLLITILVAVLVVAAVVAGLFTDWFGLVSPINGLENALEKTVRAESLTVTIKGKSKVDGDSERIEQVYRIDLNKDKETVTYLMESDELTQMYDNGDTYYLREADDDYWYPNGRAYITESEKDDPNKHFFNSYNKIFAKDDIRWDEVVKLINMESVIDKKEIDGFMKELSKKYLGDRDWLEANLGYQKKGNVYTFTPQIDTLGESLLEILENTDAIKKDGKEYIEDIIDEMMEYADDEDVNLTVSITVKKGIVTSVAVEYSDDNDIEMELDITLSDYNSTIIEAKQVADLRDKIDDMIAETTCEECGFNLMELWGDYYHGDCTYCEIHSEEGYYHTYDGEPCCEDCYYRLEWGYDNCDECGALDDLYDVGDVEMCYECYYTCCDCGDYADYTKGDYRYCYDCYYVCDECGEWGAYEYDGGLLCEGCYYKEVYGYVDCDDCGTLCDPYEYGGDDLCWDCYQKAKYSCSGCGEYGSYSQGSRYYCYDCYYDCYYCGAYASYGYGNLRYCSDCYDIYIYGYAYCDDCGTLCDPYEYGGEELCWDCYYDAYYYTCYRCGSYGTYYCGGNYYCYDCYYTCYTCGDYASEEWQGKRYCWDCWLAA